MLFIVQFVVRLGEAGCKQPAPARCLHHPLDRDRWGSARCLGPLPPLPQYALLLVMSIALHRHDHRHHHGHVQDKGATATLVVCVWDGFTASRPAHSVSAKGFRSVICLETGQTQSLAESVPGTLSTVPVSIGCVPTQMIPLTQDTELDDESDGSGPRAPRAPARKGRCRSMRRRQCLTTLCGKSSVPL